ncbi:hypothetical protein BMF94_4318 [Rhodotorula taiwanensis]|uniref:Putative peptidase domain-containing protein n=1 Tax=Rhodotorula taiwanensis TaxID=741276 RepID=A0A2S5B6T5_9BASI|nr:hypothetical protein BMF94_4318 [Rhodotorula taiwanensis]
MLPTTTLCAALLLVASAQAAPFLPSARALVKRAESASDASTNKHARTNMTEVQIHESCDAGQAHFIRAGLDDMNTISKHAYERILKYGENDELYRKYFGTASSASAAGFYAQLLYGNKPGVLFRCDNPDGNCDEVTAEGPWAGHYRGKNATEQTVICPPTYTRRKQLATLCWDGVEIGSEPPARWLATDFMHRLTHVPSITYGHIDHAADSLGGVLELAAHNDSRTAFNQNTFQFYALDAYAYDVVWPGKSCVTANPPHDEASHSAPASTSSSAAAAAATTASAEHNHSDDAHAHSATSTATRTAAAACHTHADGEVRRCACLSLRLAQLTLACTIQVHCS